MTVHKNWMDRLEPTPEETKEQGNYVVTFKEGLNEENRKYLEKIGVDIVGELPLNGSPKQNYVVLYLGSEEKRQKLATYSGLNSIQKNSQCELHIA